MSFEHIPVLLAECIENLAIQKEGLYLDGTAGGAGHSSEIAKRLDGGWLYSLDQDPDAVAAARERLLHRPKLCGKPLVRQHLSVSLRLPAPLKGSLPSQATGPKASP